ncbi:hypothetical protein [Bradyrhizobium cenepequi]
MPTKTKRLLASNPHPIASAALAVVEEIAALAALVSFIAAALLWAGVIGGSI